MDTLPFAYEGDPQTGAVIMKALRRVVDPEMAFDIVDIGLVVAVRAAGDAVALQLIMTSAACPVADLIVDDVYAELGRVLPRGTRVDVEILADPVWSPERMSSAARAFMGWGDTRAN